MVSERLADHSAFLMEQGRDTILWTKVRKIRKTDLTSCLADFL